MAVRHLRYPFAVHPAAGKVREQDSYEAYVRSLIWQVLLTAKGERVCRPEFGAGLRRQVFANLRDTTAALTRTLVFEALTHWLGTLIKVEKVEVTAADGVLRVLVEYLILARGERRILNEEVPI